MKEEEYVEADDKDGGDREEYDAVTRIHPASIIFIICPVGHVWEEDEQRPDPAQETEAHQALLPLSEWAGQEHPEKDALTQHPEVGCHHEVCGQDIQTPTPYGILGPDIRLEEDEVIPLIINF